MIPGCFHSWSAWKSMAKGDSEQGFDPLSGCCSPAGAVKTPAWIRDNSRTTHTHRSLESAVCRAPLSVFSWECSQPLKQQVWLSLPDVTKSANWHQSTFFQSKPVWDTLGCRCVPLGLVLV